MKQLRIWAMAFVVVTIYFYALDQVFFSIQGLPLNFDMTPAQ